jgi:hypothetical protein
MASVWVFQVERGVEEGGELALFWRRTAVEEAVSAYLADRWPRLIELPSEVGDAIERYNRAPGVAEHVVVDLFEIRGSEQFDGDTDSRRRCGLCGEPVELADAGNPESWVQPPMRTTAGITRLSLICRPTGRRVV